MREKTSHPDYRLRAPGVGQKGDDLHGSCSRKDRPSSARSVGKLKSRTLVGTMSIAMVDALFLFLNTTTTHQEKNIMLQSL
jgi:hypothetical protein